MNNQYLLSICIPTYNRSCFLEESLNRIYAQRQILGDKVELVVSNNNSTDRTEEVIYQFIDKGLPIKYIKNRENIGPDGNIAQCFSMCTGRYAWILGDDDYLKPNTIQYILDVIDGKEYGVIHLVNKEESNEKIRLICDSNKYMQEINYWITFISTNIVNRKYVSKDILDKNMGTFLVQVPIYITALTQEKNNILMFRELIEDGADNASNGGYNIFNIFVNNYLNLLNDFVTKGVLNKTTYKINKYQLFKSFLIQYIYSFLIKKESSNHQTNDGWKILMEKYKFEPYFYFGIIYLYIKKVITN